MTPQTQQRPRGVSWMNAGIFWVPFQLKKSFVGSALLIMTTVGVVVGEDALPVPVPVIPVPIPFNVPGVNFQNGLILDEGDLGLDGEGVEPPEMAIPYAPAQPSAIILRWDNYRTLIVIDASAGLIKSCWIVTLAVAPEQIPAVAGGAVVARNQVVVSYRGQAYFDKDKILHIDGRRARLGGALAQGWSPDSFAITPDKKVSATDDAGHPGNSGEVEKVVPADTQAAEYRKLMFTAQTIIEGNI